MVRVELPDAAATRSVIAFANAFSSIRTPNYSLFVVQVPCNLYLSM